MSKKDSAAPSIAIPAPVPKQDGTRDFIEAIVIAFVLAFMFRAFEAEAFVIPTGSMAPNLMGVHHDVNCEICGYRYEVNSHEMDDRLALDHSRELYKLYEARNDAIQDRNQVAVASVDRQIAAEEQNYANRPTVQGTCPICRHTMNFRDAKNQPSAAKAFSGDRLIVTKFPYEFGDPRRFDVAVFKFPDGPKENYIKRIVGLPNEDISLFHGDVFTSAAGSGDPPVIVRKPEDKLLAMAQIVHDNDYVVTTDGAQDPMLAAGWPTRWSGGDWAESGSGIRFERGTSSWKADDTGKSFAIDAMQQDAPDGWLRYQHYVPSVAAWESVNKTKQLPPETEVPRRPQLITDFYAYNTGQDVNDVKKTPESDGVVQRAIGLGLHWVGDLMLECEITVKETDLEKGAVTLELVEGSLVDAQGARVPCRFQCHIELGTGEATLRLVGVNDPEWERNPRTAATAIKGPGTYTLRFTNFDDQLRLWVDDAEVEFPQPTIYNFSTPVFDDRNNVPTEADLAPVGIQVEHASVAVNHLRIKRDIYYIATKRHLNRNSGALNDYDGDTLPILISNLGETTQREFMSNPALWKAFNSLRAVSFQTGPDDFVALGDNSPQSADSRLWEYKEFVPRRMLIGEALFIYWPHSWFFPVPNVKDMGFVK